MPVGGYMKRQMATGALIGGLALAGCASTRGGQDVDCEGFEAFATPARTSGIMRDIQDLPPRFAGLDPTSAAMSVAAQPSPIEEAVEALYAPSSPKEFGTGEGKRNLLLLSGGGQWGAYGAGLFLGLACSQSLAEVSPGRLPCRNDDGSLTGLDYAKLDALDIGLITGVSTGGLQSLLLMLVLDPNAGETARTAALQQLVNSYLPADETDLVYRNSEERAIITGSIAGTNPLRRHVSEVLEKPRSNLERSFVELLRESRIAGFVGFVDASDGEFKYVRVDDMLRKIPKDEAASPGNEDGGEQPRYSRATRCVVATTMASAAMPVFHQQLRVRDDTSADASWSTLFDGGVRRSVFFAEIAETLRKQAKQRAEDARKSGQEAAEEVREINKAFERLRDEDDGSGAMVVPDPRVAQLEETASFLQNYAESTEMQQIDWPTVYVLRNGPTTRDFDGKVDAVVSARPQALRAYDLLVNELEVGSIAALRLANPEGEIRISTAEGVQARAGNPNGGTCTKEKSDMFNPDFMRCLMRAGVARAQVDGGPWWRIATLSESINGLIDAD